MGQHGDLRLDAKAAHLFRRQDRHFDQFLNGGVETDMGIAEEKYPLVQDQHI